MNSNNLRILISAGETSGDQHGAELLQSIRSLRPDTEFFGMGGSALEAAGMELLVDSRQAASLMGFAEVLSSISSIWKALSKIKSALKTRRPDVLVLIDYPDFNLRLAKAAHALGIKVFYFITPKVWAWRSSRVKTIARYVDQAAVIFPFEPSFFAERGYKNATYVGHPFATRKDMYRADSSERSAFMGKLGLNPSQPLLALFPGSRKSEIKHHTEVVAAAIQKVSAQIPGLQIAVAVAPGMTRASLGLTNSPQISYTDRPIDLLRSADFGLIKSGTSNLQAAFCDLPFAMFFQASSINKLIAKCLVPLKEFSIVNILRPGTVTELILEKFNPPTIALELQALAHDQTRVAALRHAYAEIRKSLSFTQDEKTAYQRTAELILNLTKRS